MNCRGQILLYNSLKKHGYNNHVFEIICECCVSELNNKERYYQDLFEVIGDKGLNLKLTKTNEKKLIVSDITKLKISEAHRIRNAKKRGDYDPNKDYKTWNNKPKKKRLIGNGNLNSYKYLTYTIKNNLSSSNFKPKKEIVNLFPSYGK